MGPFDGGSAPAQSPKDMYGQRVWRDLDDFGSYLFRPRGAAHIHLNAVTAALSAEEDYPHSVSQDQAHMVRTGGGPHGGQAFYYLLKPSESVVAAPQLVPLLAASVAGLSDLTVEGLLHSHWQQWRGDKSFIGLSHWIWPGCYILTAGAAVRLIGDPASEESRNLLADIRRAITKAPA